MDIEKVLLSAATGWFCLLCADKMDIRNIALQIWDFLVFIATTSPYAVPFWLAVAWVIVLLNWQAFVRVIWRSLHLIEDLVLQRQLFAKIEIPLKVLLITMALLPFVRFAPPPANEFLQKLAGFAIPLLSLYVLVQFFDTLFFTWYLEQKRSKNVPSVLRFVALSAVYVIFGLAFLEWTLGINVLPIIATSTVLTAVLGLALQDTLKNLFAGLTMSFERRFREGDWVMFRLDATNTIVGEVVEIGWRTTKIKTIDNNFSVVPNSMFTSNQIVNYSQPTPAFPKVVEIPVKVGGSLDKILACLNAACNSVPTVLQEPKPEVLVYAVRTDHLLFRIRFWVATYSQSESAASAIIQHAYRELSKLHAIPAAPAAAAASARVADDK